MSFYRQFYTRLRPALFAMMMHGVRFDREKGVEEFGKLDQHKSKIKQKLDQIAGAQLYATKSHRSATHKKLLEEQRKLKLAYDAIPKDQRAARKEAMPARRSVAENIKSLKDLGDDRTTEVGVGLSDKRIVAYLYGTLKLPAILRKRKGTGEKTVTVDAVALKRLRLQFPQHGELLDLLLEHRKCVKLQSYLDEAKVDSDGRMRCQYKSFGTQTGRLSSVANPRGTGMNLQNVDRSLKHLFLPDL